MGRRHRLVQSLVRVRTVIRSNSPSALAWTNASDVVHSCCFFRSVGNLWANLIYVNNFVPWDDNIVRMCAMWTYVSQQVSCSASARACADV